MKSTDSDELTKEVKSDNQIVSGWLLWIYERKKEYHQKRIEIYNQSSSGPNNGIPGDKNIAGDPTGKKGEKLGDLAIAYEWINLVEEIEGKLPWKKKIFLRLRRDFRYSQGRNGWTAAVQYHYAIEAAKVLGCKPEDVWIESRNTFTFWWKEIVDITARLAAKKGMLQNNYSAQCKKNNSA